MVHGLLAGKLIGLGVREAIRSSRRQEQQVPAYATVYHYNAQQMQHIAPYPTYAPPGCSPGTTTTVVMPGAVGPYVPPPPKDHLVWSIFNAILLCPILGIIAVVFSVMTRRRKDEGKEDEARSSSQAAMGLNVAGTVLGCLFWLIGLPVILYMIVFVAETNEFSHDHIDSIYTERLATTTESPPYIDNSYTTYSNIFS